MWPKGESACIWMEAGIIDFKLCDNQRDCENCPFDAIMKNERSYSRVQNKSETATTPQKNPLQKLKNIKWDNTSYYGSRYWFVEPLGKEKALVGLNELALHIIPTVKDIILSEEGDIKKDQAVGWLVTDNGTICLNAPFDATIRKTNPALLADMGERDRKVWLFTVESQHLPDELGKLKRGKEADHLLNSRREKIVTIFESAMGTMQTGVGETMQDGGAIVTNLEQMIGAKRYFKIVCEFFKNCITLQD